LFAGSIYRAFEIPVPPDLPLQIIALAQCTSVSSINLSSVVCTHDR